MSERERRAIHRPHRYALHAFNNTALRTQHANAFYCVANLSAVRRPLYHAVPASDELRPHCNTTGALFLRLPPSLLIAPQCKRSSALHGIDTLDRRFIETCLLLWCLSVCRLSPATLSLQQGLVTRTSATPRPQHTLTTKAHCASASDGHVGRQSRGKTTTTTSTTAGIWIVSSVAERE